MMFHLGVLLVLLNLFVHNVTSVIVNTDKGMVRGEYLQAVGGNFVYASFKGIPFAKPPVGDLRFRAPEPAEPWCGVRNATEHGPICLQLSIYNEVDISGSEDCLYVNVYTPEVRPRELLPVMFFIHGGGFQSGSGNSDRYGPDYLITHNIVLVTSNHRLGALGFLSLNNREVPGNAGIKDQVEALRWIQRNIENFGGDPNKVTIFGQSSGGTSVGLHNLSPMSSGLYHRSVAMSGSPLCDWAVPFELRRIAFRLGQQLGCWTRDDRHLLKFLKSVPAVSFLGKNPAVLRSEDPRVVMKQLIFTPVKEGLFGQENFLPIDPYTALENGFINNVDLLIGHVAIEGIVKFLFGGTSVPIQYTNYTELVVPRIILERIPPINMFSLADRIHEYYFGNRQIDNHTGKEMVKYLSDASFNYGITKYGRKFSKHRKTYMYKFSKLPGFPRYVNLTNEFGTSGPLHEDDLLYLFNPGNVTIDKTTDDYKVIEKMTTLYTNYAKYGNPTPNDELGVRLPKYNTKTGYYLDIDTNLAVRKHYDQDVITFWDSIYKAAGFGI